MAVAQRCDCVCSGQRWRANCACHAAAVPHARWRRKLAIPRGDSLADDNGVCIQTCAPPSFPRGVVPRRASTIARGLSRRPNMSMGWAG
eukprot:4957596-Pyramimonas_sp.AAC.1